MISFIMGMLRKLVRVEPALVPTVEIVDKHSTSNPWGNPNAIFAHFADLS